MAKVSSLGLGQASQVRVFVSGQMATFTIVSGDEN